MNNTYTVVAQPLIDYNSDEFSRTSMIMDVWNESYENPLTSSNHYWYGGSLTQFSAGTVLNDTLDSGFEEISSDSLNSNLSIPQWFKYKDNSNVTVNVELDNIVRNNSDTSASVETRFINTSGSSYWKVPSSVDSSCGYSTYPASNTIDGNTATYWSHTTSERHWVIYDLGTDYIVNQIQVYYGSGGRINDVYVYVSSDKSNFGTDVVSGWSPAVTGWTTSPTFLKKGRYIKLDFWTTTGGPLGSNIFCEFQASVSNIPSFHAMGGIKTISDYFVNVSGVQLSTSPIFTTSLFLDDAKAGSGSVTAYYSLVDMEIINVSQVYHIIYVAPVTATGTPLKTHFTNTTTTKYIYGVVSINQFDVWKKFSRSLKNDYVNIWGAAKSATLKSITLKGDLYQPVATSTSNPPLIRINYDPITLKQSTIEQLVNGDFELDGWIKTDQNKIQTSICTKTNIDKAEGTTSYLLNITGNTAGGSGTGFATTKHQVVGTTSFIREANDLSPLRVRAFLKIYSTANLASTVYSYVALRVTFQNKSSPYNTVHLYYLVMMKGVAPSDSSSEKYVTLVTSGQTGVWYELARNPLSDSGLSNVKVTEVAMVVSFYYGENYPSTTNAKIVVYFDSVRLLKEGTYSTNYLNNLARSTTYKRGGNYSLKINASSTSIGFAKYETGSENGNNSYYIAFPRNLNFSNIFLCTKRYRFNNSSNQPSYRCRSCVWGRIYLRIDVLLWKRVWSRILILRLANLQHNGFPININWHMEPPDTELD